MLKSPEQHPGKFPFSLCLSISSDRASAADQDPGVFSCSKDVKNQVFCCFQVKSAQSLPLFCKIQTPSLFVQLAFSSKRTSLSPVTSVSAIHRSFPNLHLVVRLPVGHHTLHLTHGTWTDWNKLITLTRLLNLVTHLVFPLMASYVEKRLFLPHPAPPAPQLVDKSYQIFLQSHPRVCSSLLTTSSSTLPPQLPF